MPAIALASASASSVSEAPAATSASTASLPRAAAMIAEVQGATRTRTPWPRSSQSRLGREVQSEHGLSSSGGRSPRSEAVGRALASRVGVGGLVVDEHRGRHAADRGVERRLPGEARLHAAGAFERQLRLRQVDGVRGQREARGRRGSRRRTRARRERRRSPARAASCRRSGPRCVPESAAIEGSAPSIIPSLRMVSMRSRLLE